MDNYITNDKNNPINNTKEPNLCDDCLMDIKKDEEGFEYCETCEMCSDCINYKTDCLCIEE